MSAPTAPAGTAATASLCPFFRGPCVGAACMAYTPGPARAGAQVWQCSALDPAARWRAVVTPQTPQTPQTPGAPVAGVVAPRGRLGDLRWDLVLGLSAEAPEGLDLSYRMLDAALVAITAPPPANADRRGAEEIGEDFHALYATIGQATNEIPHPAPQLVVPVRDAHLAFPYFYGSPADPGAAPRLQIVVDIDAQAAAWCAHLLRAQAVAWLLDTGARQWGADAHLAARHLEVIIRRRVGAPVVCARLLGTDTRGSRLGLGDISPPSGLTAEEAAELEAEYAAAFAAEPEAPATPATPGAESPYLNPTQLSRGLHLDLDLDLELP